MVSSLKESFGFIERADVVSEIFFHYSEYDGDINDLMLGDDVEFGIQNRNVKFGIMLVLFCILPSFEMVQKILDQQKISIGNTTVREGIKEKYSAYLMNAV